MYTVPEPPPVLPPELTFEPLPELFDFPPDEPSEELFEDSFFSEDSELFFASAAFFSAASLAAFSSAMRFAMFWIATLKILLDLKRNKACAYIVLRFFQKKVLTK